MEDMTAMFFGTPQQTVHPACGNEALPVTARRQHLRRLSGAGAHDESGNGHAGAIARTLTISPLPQLGQHRVDASLRGFRFVE
jgi:hypothetical protein